VYLGDGLLSIFVEDVDFLHVKYDRMLFAVACLATNAAVFREKRVVAA
jgi:hypothetical protein